MNQTRREFLKGLGAGLGWCMLPGGRLYAAPAGYDGPLYIFIQADGGWDVTSLCDPKLNVPGEQQINHWANGGDIQQAGNLRYAPFASNAAFFDKYFRDMLVINGVDAQTNSHTAGVTHTWSGRLSAGFPTFTSILAAASAPGLPMSNLNFGGYQETARIIRSTRLSDPGELKKVIFTNTSEYDDTLHFQPADSLARIRRFQDQRLQRLRSKSGLSPRQKINLDIFASSLAQAQGLKAFADLLPPDDQLEPNFENEQGTSTLRQQIQLTLTAFEAGMSASADLFHSGFDTHGKHDTYHEPLMAFLTDAVDFLFTSAEQKGLTDRLHVVISSDFGRTPHYNSIDGKDHWPINSVIVMKKNAAWGNRVVGLTDEGHNAYKINPATLQRDDAQGTLIHPEHIHVALRKLAGIDKNPITQKFLFANIEDIDLFNPALMTTQSNSDPRNSVRT